MKYLPYLLLFLLLLPPLWLLLRQRIAYHKTKAMSPGQKLALLKELLSPFGYCYLPVQDAISTTNDAWQKEAGYTTLYDRTALNLNMYFDALPIYFDYRGQTWLIEFWKGQYGITSGAEVGIYHTDKILSSEERSKAIFHAVSEEEYLPVSLTLLRRGKIICIHQKRTWWLTVFLTGMFSDPRQLTTQITLTFPNHSMEQTFFRALLQSSLPRECYHVRGNRVHVQFKTVPDPASGKNHPLLYRLHVLIVQAQNRMNCGLFNLLTRPFTDTMDKILYLYALLPFTIRLFLRGRKNLHRL